MILERALAHRLRPLIDAQRTLWRRKSLAWVFGIAAALAVAFALVAHYRDWWSPWAPLALLVAAFAGHAIVRIATIRREPDLKDLAGKVEHAHPELGASLLTAIEATEHKGDGKGLTYLQERVISEAIGHASGHDWVRPVMGRRLLGAGWMQTLGVLGFAAAMAALIAARPPATPETAGIGTAPLPPSEVLPYEISVDPGNVEVERGSRLVIQATFGKRLPPAATLVVTEPGAPESERLRIPLKPGLDAHVFGGLVSHIDADADYRVEYDGERSGTFHIATFVHPALERSDATITPPEYTKTPAKEVKDTFKVSLLEGSHLAWKLKINKPVAAAELYGDDDHIIPLKPSADDPTVLEASHQPDETRKYRLHLVDEKDRGNKEPEWFTVTVNRNEPPRLDFVFPKRDVVVSAVQEVPVEAQVWDDVGVLKAGATLNVNGEETELVLADAALPGGKKHGLTTLLAMESLGVKPRDVVTYHLWAEDQAGDGTVRRSTSDMFFAEVRHFVDPFREQEGQGGQGQGGEQGEAAKLLKLQKEILNATWKLVRSADMGQGMDRIGSDVDVVKQSQGVAIGQTDEALEQVEDAEIKALFTEAKGHMQQAVEELQKAIDFKQTGQLDVAMNSERQAYASLIRAQAREHVVTRSRSASSSGQGQEQERQLMQLEMKQEERRYEEETEAQEGDPNLSPEQKENVAVLQRLSELARRQEALEKKIRELENALQEASSEEEKRELERQLKRLQEEQEQLLREVDDLRERMDAPENRANMAEEREKLDSIRENVQQAAEDLKNANLADAGNAASRAQEELKEAQEDFRQKTSRQFTEEMRGMRGKARELAEKQEALGQQLEQRNQAAASGAERPTPLEQMQLGNQIGEQAEQLRQLLEKLRQTSEAAETSEPLLSDALYDAVRQAHTAGLEEQLQEARDLTRYGRTDLATEAERAAARGLDQLRDNVEKAAERILGSEADSLRMARNELDNLIKRAQDEAERLDANPPGDGQEELPSETSGGQQAAASANTGTEPKQGSGPDSSQPGEKGDQNAQAQPGNEKGEPGSGQGSDGERTEAPPQMAGGAPGKEGEEKPAEDARQGSELAGQAPGKGTSPGEPGQEPGEGQPGSQESKAQAQALAKGSGQGQEPRQSPAPGEGQEPGQSPGEGQGQGKGEPQGATSLAQGQGQGQGGQPGAQDSPGQGQGRQAGGQRSGSRQGGASLSGGDTGGFGGPNDGGDDRRSNPLLSGWAQAGKPLFFEGAEETAPAANPNDPITGDGYDRFSDSLRNIEGMLERDELKNEAARVSDNARAMRIDHRKDNLPPQARTIRTRIINPLLELRDAVAEELARKDQQNPLSPVDRDPVPKEFRDLVRRYYEQLGAGQ